MDKILVGVLTALGTVVASANGQAAPEADVLHASSYADLLRPVPNAAATLRAMDAAMAAEVETVQYIPIPVPVPAYRHHHHHHHHQYVRRRYYHHHHHNYGRPYWQR